MLRSYYFILCCFLLAIKSICFSINQIVQSKTATGTLSSFVLTRAENPSKPSHSIFFISKSSWCNFFLTISKIFSIAFKSGLPAATENFCVPILSQADLGLQLFCDISPSCKKKFPFGLGHVLNMLAVFMTKKEISALILPKYCSRMITLLPYVIAAISVPHSLLFLHGFPLQ